MSTDSIHKINIPITNLPPTTVKVFPTCAQIERETKGIVIKPGRNKITIPNLTRYADEQSVKVEGTGDLAVITDISVEMIHNATLWPEDDEDDEALDPDTDDESDSEENIAKMAGDDAVACIKEWKAAKREQSAVLEQMQALTKRRSILREYGDKFIATAGKAEGYEPHALLEKYLKTDKTEGDRLREEYEQLTTQHEELVKKISALERRKDSLLKEGRKRWKRRAEQKRRAREEKERAFADKMAEKGPKFGAVHRVIVWIEGTGKGEVDIGLKLSYIAKNASWAPRYDINLTTSTATPTATLTYRAHVINMTGEAWTECTVILSTSQATFQGLNDAAPTLEQWNIRQARSSDYDFWQLNKDGKEKLVLYSSQEKPGWYNVVTQNDRIGGASKGVQKLAMASVAKKAARSNISYAPQQVPYPTMEMQSQQQQLMMAQQQRAQAQAMSQQMQMASLVPPAPAPAGGLFGASRRENASRDRDRGGEAFRFSANANESSESEAGFGLFDEGTGEGGGNGDEGEDIPSDDDDASETATLGASTTKMRFATPSHSSSGLTTTYTLQSPLTIPSSSLPRRHLIAELTLNKVELQHLCIPKLRAAVFLKAKIKNTSTTPLLKGMSGLTLDGSFLGSLPITSSQPGEEFSLPLGVDTSVHVVYGKVQRKKALEKGIWNKESTTGFSRSITLQNARPSPVSILVIDQVPVSEDEKIKVSVVNPKGLEPPSEEGSRGTIVSTGIPLGLNSNESSSNLSRRLSTIRNTAGGGSAGGVAWGSAKAEMKRNGEIRWNVDLRGGKGVGLALDYQVAYPKDTGIISA